MRWPKMFVMLVSVYSGLLILPQLTFAQQLSVSFQLFYDELSPYGVWVEYPDYGYVWIPNGNPGFSPYATDGCWVYTDDGWVWISDYPWGWAAFHYGRWDYDNSFGWFWVPDNEWGPAWVAWRRSPGYFGWAPLRPGISISLSFGGEYRERNDRWIFIRERDISRRDVSRYYIDRSRNVTIINNSTMIVNTRKDNRRNSTYIVGPTSVDVEKATSTPVRPIAIRDSDRPGHRLSDGELQMYRPQVMRKNGNGRNPAPSIVKKLADLKPASERSARNQQREVKPSGNNRKVQKMESREAKPSVRRQREKQSPTVAPQNNSRVGKTSQPKTSQGTKSKKKRD